MRLEISLQPKQIDFAEAVEKYPITFYGGAKGGGKSHGLRNIVLARRFQYEKSTAGIFRRTYKELEGNHIRPLFKQFPELRKYWNDSKSILTLPNGSTIEFCHCQNESDVDLYQGREYHDLAIDEAGQWLEPMFTKLLGSNRSSDIRIKPRAMLTGNPGGLGHTWLKRRFIERRFTERERPEDHIFIQAKVDDNYALKDADPDYVHKLESEPNEALRRAFRHGDWDIFAGQFFGEIDRSVHLIDPFPIPPHWSRSGSYDFGFNHPAAFGWFAVDGDGNVYLYREFIKAGLRVDEFIKELQKFDDTKDLERIIGGLDCWATKSVVKSGVPPTIAEEFMNHSLYLARAITDRVQGANQLRQYLSWRNKNGKSGEPKFFIFKTCPITFDCLTRMQHDPDRIEDVLKQDATEGDVNSGDDPYDMVRYFLMSRPLLANTPPPPERGTPEYAKKEEEEMFEIIITRRNEEKKYNQEMFGEE